MNALEIKHLDVAIAEKLVLKDFSLMVPKGEVHALMGPNGSGKSTLGKTLSGHPDYKIRKGQILLDGRDLTSLSPEDIAIAGLFMAFQYPNDIPGVSIANFIRAALQARLKKGESMTATAYYKKLYEKMDLLQIDRSFTARSVNEGFSGGEKKRCEILQMMMLEPHYAIMDETDSGLDIDALKIVGRSIAQLHRSCQSGLLIITHYPRLLEYIIPDKVHILWGGHIVHTGKKELALELEEKGYDWFRDKYVSHARKT